MQNLDFADIFIKFIVLLFSLTVHEMAHAWTADRLGDPTARLLGRVSLNPIVHADPIGTIVFPLVSMISGAMLIGWAKPVPVTLRYLRHPRRDYIMVAAAGPASNLVLALFSAILLAILPISPLTLGESNVSVPIAKLLSGLVQLNVVLAIFNMLPIPPLDGGNVIAGLLPPNLAVLFNKLRPYGFVLLYLLVFSSGFEMIVLRPSYFILSWLTK